MAMVSSLDGIAIRALGYREFEVYERAMETISNLWIEIELTFGGQGE
jgi:hypothetical protein